MEWTPTGRPNRSSKRQAGGAAGAQRPQALRDGGDGRAPLDECGAGFTETSQHGHLPGLRQGRQPLDRTGAARQQGLQYVQPRQLPRVPRRVQPVPRPARTRRSPVRSSCRSTCSRSSISARTPRVLFRVGVRRPASRRSTRLVYLSDLYFLTPARELIAGWYGGSFTTSSAFLDDFVPVGWTGNDNRRQLYKQVVARGCRTCHISAPGINGVNPALAFGSRDDFEAYKGLSAPYVCGPTKYNASGGADHQSLLEILGAVALPESQPDPGDRLRLHRVTQPARYEVPFP